MAGVRASEQIGTAHKRENGEGPWRVSRPSGGFPHETNTFVVKTPTDFALLRHSPTVKNPTPIGPAR